jgi:hypothetical protein
MNLKGKTNVELVLLSQAIEQDPRNQNPPGSLNLYTAAARRKLSAIAWAITANLAESRQRSGRPVTADGYSGRQSKRRR